MASEHYAIPVEKALEVLDYCKITKIPKTEDHLLGVINLRGEVLPVIDIRRRFDMPVSDDTLHTKIIILDLMQKQKQHITGILVDTVNEVFEVSNHQIEEIPPVGNNYASILSGMVKWKKDYVLLLNLEKIFTKQEETV
jgi:purine-binding chemotaxis protein CheW